MTTRTKVNIAACTAIAMMLLNVCYRLLYIPSDIQWVLIIGTYIPLGFLWRYNKLLKQEEPKP